MQRRVQLAEPRVDHAEGDRWGVNSNAKLLDFAEMVPLAGDR